MYNKKERIAAREHITVGKAVFKNGKLIVGTFLLR